MDSTRPIRALLRGLEALTVLNLRDGATVSEVAHEIGLPRTTVYRILETLCDSGYAFRDAADEHYRLTPLVRYLSTGFDDEAWLRLARPHLHELGEAVVWPIYLATSCEAKLVVREATDHLSPLTIERYTAGMRLPLLDTAAGRVYLAFAAERQRALLLEKLGRSRHEEDRLARDPAGVQRLLAEIQAQGYASAVRNRQRYEEHSISVPVALQNHDPAALAVRFAASAVPLKAAMERFLPKLRHCAAKISTTFSQAIAAQAGTRDSSTAV